MSLPTSLHAYPQELDAFERALASDKGVRYPFLQEGPARHFISRLNRMRALHRKANSEALEPGHPLYGRSEFDLFTCFVRFDGDKWWVYIRKIGGLDVEYEELTEDALRSAEARAAEDRHAGPPPTTGEGLSAMILTPRLAESLWYRARDEEYGVIVPIPESTNVLTVKSNLNIARRKANDPSLFDLRLFVYEDGRSIILQRKQQDTLP